MVAPRALRSLQPTLMMPGCLFVPGCLFASLVVKKSCSPAHDESRVVVQACLDLRHALTQGGENDDLLAAAVSLCRNTRTTSCMDLSDRSDQGLEPFPGSLRCDLRGIQKAMSGSDVSGSG